MREYVDMAQQHRRLTRHLVARLMAQQLVLGPVHLWQASCHLLWQLKVPAARAS